MASDPALSTRFVSGPLHDLNATLSRAPRLGGRVPDGTEDFRFTGRYLSQRGAMNRRNSAFAVILRQDRVLLVQPWLKRRWQLPGGAIEAGETPWKAALREVKE